jgi:hypothetical protein
LGQGGFVWATDRNDCVTIPHRVGHRASGRFVVGVCEAGCRACASFDDEFVIAARIPLGDIRCEAYAALSIVCLLRESKTHEQAMYGLRLRNPK